ncbi:MAG: nucleotide exchange factor GrpE [Candidatus Woesearchaeota archaeon]
MEEKPNTQGNKSNWISDSKKNDDSIFKNKPQQEKKLSAPQKIHEQDAKRKQQEETEQSQNEQKQERPTKMDDPLTQQQEQSSPTHMPYEELLAMHQQLEQLYKESKENREELIGLLQRLQADFENFKKRTEKNAQEIRVFANTQLIKELLPVLDQFTLAKKHLHEYWNKIATGETSKSPTKSNGKNDQPIQEDKNSDGAKQWQPIIEGILYAIHEFESVLEKQGLQKMEALHQQFNPMHHEVLTTQESQEPPGTIIEVYQEGYLLHDKIIRHAKVKVSKGMG